MTLIMSQLSWCLPLIGYWGRTLVKPSMIGAKLPDTHIQIKVPLAPPASAHPLQFKLIVACHPTAWSPVVPIQFEIFMFR